MSTSLILSVNKEWSSDMVTHMDKYHKAYGISNADWESLELKYLNENSPFSFSNNAVVFTIKRNNDDVGYIHIAEDELYIYDFDKYKGNDIAKEAISKYLVSTELQKRLRQATSDSPSALCTSILSRMNCAKICS